MPKSGTLVSTEAEKDAFEIIPAPVPVVPYWWGSHVGKKHSNHAHSNNEENNLVVAARMKYYEEPPQCTGAVAWTYVLSELSPGEEVEYEHCYTVHVSSPNSAFEVTSTIRFTCEGQQMKIIHYDEVGNC